jgi:hypothetical protein
MSCQNFNRNTRHDEKICGTHQQKEPKKKEMDEEDALEHEIPYLKNVDVVRHHGDNRMNKIQKKTVSA